MSFADETEPARPTRVVFRCRRCLGLHTLETPDPERHLEELVAQQRTTTVVRCNDGTLAVAEVVGCGPGAWPPTLPERPADDVVIKERKR
jgi:hypothetical protein